KRSKSAFDRASRFTHHVSRFTGLLFAICQFAICYRFLVARITHHASRFTSPSSHPPASPPNIHPDPPTPPPHRTPATSAQARSLLVPAGPRRFQPRVRKPDHNHPPAFADHHPNAPRHAPAHIPMPTSPARFSTTRESLRMEPA